MNTKTPATYYWFLVLFSLSLQACAQSNNKNQTVEKNNSVNKIVMKKKMKVEIWSDIICPFCYIGKRNLEAALEQFANKDYIEIEWKSYELDPSIPEIPKENYQDYLVKTKGMGTAQVKGMLDNVTASAKEVGLVYDFDKAVMVSSSNAHKLIQFAKTKGLGNEMEERLFSAFFTEGKNIADLATLTQLGKEIGLDEAELKTAFTDDQYAYSVKQDIQEAEEVGVRGVPFFVFDRNYAISGAQPAQIFLEQLEKAFTEWRKLNPETKLKVTQGQSCTKEGICE